WFTSPPMIQSLSRKTTYPAVWRPSQSAVGSNVRSRKVLGLTGVQSRPSQEHHTSLLQIRGKGSLSPGFQPPSSHILPRKVSAPAPSRGAKAALPSTCTHRKPLTSRDGAIRKGPDSPACADPPAATLRRQESETRSGTVHQNVPEPGASSAILCQVRPSSEE